jgi:hypothetical protein
MAVAERHSIATSAHIKYNWCKIWGGFEHIFRLLKTAFPGEIDGESTALRNVGSGLRRILAACESETVVVQNDRCDNYATRDHTDLGKS